MAAAPLIEVTAFTHPGRVRENNQDSITVAGWVSDIAMPGLRRSRHELDEPLICAIADGLGGHSAGEVASRYAVKQLAAPRCWEGEAGVRAVLAAINAELYQTMAAEPDFIGMGTTVVGLLLTAERVVWFNVGDSRLYRCGEGVLQRISIDDVPPGQRTGIITQSLGGSFGFIPVAPHIGSDALAVPSRWLLCSDGLTDMLSDAEIARCMAASGDEEAAQDLIEAAMAAGGHDNISIIIVSVGPAG
jgi:serine/threonine protein phosphatase PrpC